MITNDGYINHYQKVHRDFKIKFPKIIVTFGSSSTEKKELRHVIRKKVLNEKQRESLSNELVPFICSGAHIIQRDCHPSALNTFVEAVLDPVSSKCFVANIKFICLGLVSLASIGQSYC